ncbi:MAG: SdrD B-like domain-containing protein [Saprospiraceae bacterium]
MGKACIYHLYQTSARLNLCGLLVLFFLAPALLPAQLSVEVTHTNISCFGTPNGSATAMATGGQEPYSYLWSNGGATAQITGLAAGTYTVTVTDAAQNTATGMAMITQPAPLGVQVYGESQICGIAPDGKATAVPFGGSPPYTYLWNNGGTTAQITGLPAGTYTVTVTDMKGCTTSGSATVYFWDEGIWLMDSTVDVSCFGLNNGFAHVSAMSGTPPYTYQWSNGAMTADVFDLEPGDYSVTVTDSNGCDNFIDVTISEPSQINCEATSTPGACGGAGTASVDPTGGTPPYSVMWSNGETTFTITAPPGDYGVTVTDANDCICSSDVTIGSSSDSLMVQVSILNGAGCTVGGDAMAVVTNGSGSYTYLWDNGQTTATATNLTVGLHSVTVSDINSGCGDDASANIPLAPTLEASASVVANATCAIGGSAEVSATGGSGDYEYLWDNGQTTALATNLGAGPHSVTVTDEKGCIATSEVNVGQDQGPEVTIDVISNATCTTGGSAQANATGGTPPYTYLWDDGQMTALATGLSAGMHSVTVTDSVGCSSAANVTIEQTGTPELTVDSIGNEGCDGNSGSVTIGVSGGTAPYEFLWDNGAMTAMLDGLSAGDYSLTVTDSTGCTASITITIDAVTPPTVTITGAVDANCSQPGSATATISSGGSSPFSYLWDNNETNATATDLAAGAHSVTVTDANGCTGTASVTIGQINSGGIKVGDYVWYDDDQNGAQHPLESGVPGISVMLMTAGPDGQFETPDDEMVDSTGTDANGKYLFDCVLPGTYIVMFGALPAGYEFTDKDKVNNDCADSDAKSNGKTAPFTIMPGQGDNLCVDAGIHIFCDNVLNAGVVCCNQTICEGDTPAMLYNVQSPSGGSGPIEYQWLQLLQMGPAPPTWVAIPGATNETYQPGPLSQTSYFMRCARREGCVTFLESNIITITVQPAGSPGCEDFTMDLNARVAGHSTVIIEWTTTLPETAPYMYVVEHSTDKVVWNDALTVMGKHDATKPNHYTVTHQTPASGMNHYRVKRLDAMGVASYSQIRSLQLDIPLTGTVDIFPNPVSKVLTIKNIQAYDADIDVSIINTGGDVLHTLTIKQGTLIYEELPVENLPAGLYMARVRFSNGEVKTYKITKI